MKKQPAKERFWEKVNVQDSQLCWDWLAGKTLKGRGSFRNDTGSCLAHRFAWEITHGGIPQGLLVCHKCDNPLCCNPDHLFLGTNRENNQDMIQKGRGFFPKGVRNGRARLSEFEVRFIRYWVDRGYTHDSLLSSFQVTKQMLRNIGLRKSWAHLSEEFL